MTRVLALLAILVTSLARPAFAETPAEAYQRSLAARTQVQQVRFRDDPTDVAGKTYEFAKAALDAFGIPGNFLDAADFARTLSADGFSAELAGGTLVKVLAQNVPTARIEALVGRMEQAELMEVARIIGLHTGEDSGETAGNLQRLVVDYFSETLPKAAGTAHGGDPGGAVFDTFIDVLGRVCKTCGAAYRAYDLAVEAAKAGEIFVDNLGTQAMFRDMAIAGWYRFDEFSQNFTGSPAMLSEARKALEAARAAAGRNDPATDQDVLRYVYDRYQRWQTEIAQKDADAAVLAAAQSLYEGLLDYEKRAMFGEGSETDWASRYMNDYLTLWNGLVGMRGDAPWPFGLGQETVRFEVNQLLRRWRTEGLTDAQVGHELRQLAARWGWISPDRVGAPPPAPLPPAPPRIENRDALVSRITGRIGQLSYTKLTALLENAGITPSGDFYECLCNGYGGDFHFHSEPGAPNVCGRMGPLGGMTWTGFPPGSFEGCAGLHTLDDGRTVIGALADRIEAIRAGQGSP